MTRFQIILSVGILLFSGMLVGCDQTSQDLINDIISGADDTRNFTALLTGDDTGVDTSASGQAVFQLSKDGTQLSYRLQVSNLENVTMAHIHLAPAGEQNGPVALWLYPAAAPAQPIPGVSNGVLAQRTATEADLVGPLAGMTFADLVDGIETGRAYVNVHTEQSPGGEIRGRIY